MDIGKYNRLFTWMRYTPTADATLGEVKENWVASMDLWGALNTDSGAEDTFYDGIQATERATIRVRGWYAISGQDRLTDVKWDEVWEVDGVQRGINEMTITAHKWEQQDGTL